MIIPKKGTHISRRSCPSTKNNYYFIIQHTHAQYTIRDATKTDDVVLRIPLLLLLHRVARTSNVMSSWESYPMYTLKGISFVANASLFDIIFSFVLRVFFCAEKNNKKQKMKKGDGRWSSKMRHRQRNSYNVSFFRSIDRVFFLCVLCVCFGWTFCHFLVAMFHQKM